METIQIFIFNQRRKGNINSADSDMEIEIKSTQKSGFQHIQLTMKNQLKKKDTTKQKIDIQTTQISIQVD